MILVTEDVGDEGLGDALVALLDQAHRDARDRGALMRHARVHQRQRRRRRRVAIDDEPLDSVISETTRMRVRELVLRQGRMPACSARQASAVADLATPR